MPEETKEMSEEEKQTQYLSMLAQMAQTRVMTNTADEAAKLLSKPEGVRDRSWFSKLEELLLPAGKVMNPADPDMLLQASPQLVGHFFGNYEREQKKTLDQYVQDNKGRVVLDYSSVVNQNIGSIVAGKSKLPEKLSPEEKDLRTELAIYSYVGGLASKLSLNPDYQEGEDKDDELIALLGEVKSLEGLEGNELRETMAQRLIEKYHLPKEYAAMQRPWEEIRNKSLEIYTRTLGKKLVKKTDKGFEIDQALLTKAYGGYEGILDMAPEAFKKYITKKD
jgi:hypothetical protein